ncbi:MAG: tyrosine-type recombinase/integrase, partial [Kiloniellales bacterium]
DALPRGKARADPAWGPLVDRLADKRLATGLATFLNWCSTSGIAPATIDDETIEHFHVWLETRTLCPKPQDLVRRVPRLWNEARSQVPGWPQTKLSLRSFRKPREHLDWSELASSFVADADAYLALRRKPDLFAAEESAPRRPLADSTLRQQREHIRIAASLVARRHVCAQQVQQLAELVTPEAFKVVLRHYYERAQSKPNAFAISIAKTLIDVARFHAGASPDHLAELKRLMGKLPAVPLELTEKNKALIADLDADRVRAALYRLPEEVLAEVSRKLDASRFPFVQAQVAIAVDIELVAPLRPQNLSRLNWRRHFSEPNGPRGRLLLHISAEETKSRRRELIFELPPDVAQRLRWYRKHLLPSLDADADGDLFVVEGGKPKAQGTLSQQVSELILARVGLKMTIHQFRHVAAVFYLEDHPEDFETVRELLGHAWSKTTRIYAGNGSKRASRAFGDFVARQREQLRFKGKRPRRPRKQ